MNDDLYRKYANDPQELLRDIDLELEQIDMDDFPLLPLDGGVPNENEVRDGRPRHTVVELLLDRSKQALREACCDKLDYCSIRQKHGDTVQLIQAVADSLISAYVKFPLPIAMIASYCVLSLFLDRICDCDANGPRNADLSNKG